MLSIISQKISDEIIKKYNLDEEKVHKILEYIQNKKEGTYIYPEIIEEKFSLELSYIIKLLIKLENNSRVKQVYKTYCPICRDFSQNFYEDINDLEENASCEYCGKDLIVNEDKPFKFVVVYFRKVKNG